MTIRMIRDKYPRRAGFTYIVGDGEGNLLIRRKMAEEVTEAPIETAAVEPVAERRTRKQVR